MTTYIVRVQLNDGTPQNYTRLKNTLLNAGFSKKIVAGDGSTYILPNGNYRGESDRTLEEITTMVRQIALKLDRAPMILVTESKEKGNSWYGLPKA